MTAMVFDIEKKERLAENQKRYYYKIRSEDPERYKTMKKRARLKRNYSLTLEQYQEMIDKQNDLCAICKQPFSGQIDVDHCHDTGKVRGILCTHCNKGIGCLRDNITIVESALDYLRTGGFRYGD